jgi:A/G-specific adenine glycosylase
MKTTHKPLDKKRITIFRQNLLRWFWQHGRTFPWRQTRDPYRVLLAEMLLQKTNVAKVLPVYKQLVAQYPTVQNLAKANTTDLKIIIRPLGLLYRAHRLKKMAQGVVTKHDGMFPNTPKELHNLYGVGDYMTNAVLSFAYEQPRPIVDTNVIRVFDRFFGVKSRKPRARTDQMLWQTVGQTVPPKRAREFNLAILDLSALVCTAREPQCAVCPLKKTCLYYK